MKVKYKCIVEIECLREITQGTPEKVIDEYKKMLNYCLEEKMEEAITEYVVSESDYVHVERVYLNIEQ